MGRRVLLRVDLNSPVDERTLRLVDGSKIESSIITIRELVDRAARVAILAHQGRPGDYDFIPLNEHAAYLSQYLGRKVRYVDDLTGRHALNAIDNLAEGECILLKNVRYYAEEQVKKTTEEHSQSDLIQRLAPEFDLFVNDAFASAHRSHASLVGFAPVLPSIAGRLMEREIRTLTKVFQNPPRPSVFIFGGRKFADAIPVMSKLANRECVDRILVAGLLGYAFRWAQGRRIGSRTEDVLRSGEDITDDVIRRASELMAGHADKIQLPVDAAIDADGRRQEHTIDDIPADAAIMDIGRDTIRLFEKEISAAKTVFISGPPGVFEREEFSVGTSELLRAAVASEALTVVGGGHSCAAARKYGILDEFSYVSTGGGAMERLMLGKEMPVIEALRESAKRF